MALLTKADLLKMDYAFQGQPFVSVPSKDSIDLTTMDYAFQGQPFVVGFEAEAPPAGWDHKWNAATISKWNTVIITKWNDLE